MLSWKLLAWLVPQLSPEQQAELKLRQDQAYAQLGEELMDGLPQSARDILGLPSPDLALRLFGDMRRSLLA